MTEMKILVVEDEEKEFKHYSDWVDDFNEEKDSIKIELIRAQTADEAHENLKSNTFHGAIIDLNLYGDNHATEASGNKVIDEILKEYRIPVIVISGDTANLVEVDVAVNSEFFKVYERDGISDEEVFQSLIQIFNTGILNIIGGKGLIEEKLSRVFWCHLSPNLKAWIPPEEGAEKSLLRYTLNHLLAYLDVPDSGKHLYHNAEFYIKPNVKPYISPGDIVHDGDDRYILLSPACDVEVRATDGDGFEINASSLVLGKIDKITRDNFIKNGIINHDDNAKAREKKLEEVVKGTNPKILFIPDYMEIEAGVINLQDLKTVDKTTYSSYTRIATVASEYLKEIQSKFASYYARPGQPDLNKRQLLKDHKSKLSPPKIN